MKIITMLQSFNKYDRYLNIASGYILKIILDNPQFNNFKDIGDIFDVYIREFVKINARLAPQITLDCKEMVEFFLDEDYIYHMKSSFEFEEDVYHYLAILVQFNRICNRYKLKSLSPYHYYNPTNMYKTFFKIVF